MPNSDVDIVKVIESKFGTRVQIQPDCSGQQQNPLAAAYTETF